MNGDIVQDGELELCSISTGFEETEFPLSESCARIQAMLPATETPGSNQNGNFYENFVAPVGGWLSSNTQNIFDFFNPNPTPPPGYNTVYVPTPADEEKDNTVLYIVVVAVLLLVGFLLYRKMKK
jgi:hypothetical protein